MAGLQVNLYVSIAITWFAAVAAVILRVVARRILRVHWWIDDYFCLLAMVFATGYCGILLPWTAHWYLGKRIPPTVDQATRDDIYYHHRKLAFFNSLCYASSLACTKISILSFYWRLFKTSMIRIPIIVMLVVSSAWWILRTFMLIFRCVPTRAIWDQTITNATCNIDIDKFYMGTITTHFLLDVTILILPILPVANLRMRLQQKIAIVGFFLLGTIVCAASCVVLVILVTYPAESGQAPYDYATFCIWGVVEVNIAIVSACCPLLRPIARRVCPTMFSSVGTSTNPTYDHTQRSKAIKMSTVTRTEKTSKEDDSSSIQRLAENDDWPLDDFAQREAVTGVQTNISSEAYNLDHARREVRWQTGGINVQKETVVEVKAV